MILVLGGTKSGKSSFASRRAAGRENLGPVTYLATALAGDGEMKDRIARHQADRPSSWITVEEPVDPAGYFTDLIDVTTKKTPPAVPATVLLDCITLWLTNLLTPMGDEPNRGQALELGRKEVRRLVDEILAWESGDPSLDREAIIVSNLVETGLISPWPLGRIFQDLAGLTHQMIAAEANEVFLLTAGLPQRIK
ncbi:MAG: bifunctional adenosylcobinamide kinase/adenosylcobinamide-phosphate guanylyltransferase [Spirochaetaceae bacterium]|nr:bifunctional adenosylcobinamide kinase/adenosylcobinamide-phosphate guanylyltransferase [Spirochaetaceae bacterium]MDT8298314.1 bifunctional adenosylcobinamide kinase/adenosylcobinamide-phosphate guanylyltransferase [Spirochaetaceae bacterium]